MHYYKHVLNFFSGEKKTEVVPKFLARRIGNVNIFELEGIFAEPWVTRTRQEMNKTLEMNPCHGLLLDLREVETLDHPGAEAILATARKPRRSGILGHNLSAYFVAEHMRPNEPIPIFESASEVVGFFRKEFAQGGKSLLKERRRFPRIQTAVPAEFELGGFGDSFRFEAVVTNLSQGGLYGQFLDSRTEALARRVLDPFDLKLLKIRFLLPEEKALEIEGKVLRPAKDVKEVSGVAVEFYNARKEDELKIQQFLKSAGGEPLEEDAP